MSFRLLVLGFAALTMGIVGVAASDQAAKPAEVPTFTKDVAPILFKNCTSCHRPGEIAPMSLLTYEDARPYARAIFEEVRDGHMPPWHADAPDGTFLNERKLTAAEKDILSRWANGGAPKGTTPMPPAPTYSDGWQLGTPDKTFEMTEAYEVPVSGTVNYEYFYVPANLTSPAWVKGIEIRPERALGRTSRAPLLLGEARPDRTQVLVPNREQSQFPDRGPGPIAARGATRRRPILVATYAPGTNPQIMPADTAIKLDPGGVFEFQMHYTTNGTATKDRTRVGLFLSKDPSPREVRISQFVNTQLILPAGEADVAVDAEVAFSQPTTLWGLSLTRICAARSGGTCSCCPTARSRRFLTSHATTSTGRRTTCSRNRSRFPRRKNRFHGVVRQLGKESG